jgi:hypothetical protein
MTDERRWRIIVYLETARELLVKSMPMEPVWTKEERDFLAKVTTMLDDKLWELGK